MAFPVVETTAESATTAAGTAHAITLPSGIASGDLILVVVGNGATAGTFNAVAGWPEVLDESMATGVHILARTADGSEGATLNLTSSASIKTATIAYRISGAEDVATQLPEIGTVATGDGTTPDPGSTTPTGGAKDYLWVAMFNMAGERLDNDTWCTAPADYTGLFMKTSGTGGTNISCELATAQRALNATSEDPGAFTTIISFAWRAYTIAVHPAAGAAAELPLLVMAPPLAA